jgi:antitoxin (DNA-binding transcriptional repressor) of toxin-antitoxin stability system
MITISVSEFRSNMPAFLEKVKQGVKLVLTSHGKTVAEITPPTLKRGQITEEQAAARKRLAEIAKNSWVGDVESPDDVEWKVMRDDYRP